MKEDLACLNNHNAGVYHNFAEIKGVKTRHSETLFEKEKRITAMEANRRMDSLKYESQEKS